MILHNLTKTCDACPTQWSATNEDGREVYIRYRWDTLTVHVDAGFNQIYWQSSPHTEVFRRANVSGDGDGLMGAMETTDMLKITGYVEEGASL